jgi:CHAT domain-containing protein
LTAFVLRADGQLGRVELGTAGEVRRAVEDWQNAIGVGALERGFGVGEEGGRAAEHERATGERLRALALDPALRLTGDARRILIVADGRLHLVPFDALPAADGSLLGEHWRIERRLALLELTLAPENAGTGEGDLVAVGGLDYDRLPGPRQEVLPSLVAEPAAAHAARSSLHGSIALQPGFSLPFLPGTQSECEAIVALAPEGLRSWQLSKDQATSEALRRLCPRARFLHVATHGIVALPSADETAARENADTRRPFAFARIVDELTPMSRCALALSGANVARDRYGRATGLLTAEQLSTFDLGRCELAVLSACDSGAGMIRAGVGIASIQRALHAAGARYVLASVWPVGDEPTARLMEDFYRGLWHDGLGAADALWRAKSRLREAGHPLRDWGGWVLTGSSD